jgi:hypothetical protein
MPLFKSKTIVNCAREPYLKRWYLFRCRALGIFLHRFFRSDEERALHDHPWSFITVILWRGYIEHCEQQCAVCGYHQVAKRRWPLTIHFRHAEWRHRVELIGGKPSWTLVFRFRERRDWGFWEPNGFVRWNHWWQKHCE